MRNFVDLIVWQKAHELTLGVYEQSKVFPKAEMFGITSQLRRSSSSIAANMAEGCGRDGNKESIHFLQIARGSASETHYHLMLARDLGYIGYIQM